MMHPAEPANSYAGLNPGVEFIRVVTRLQVGRAAEKKWSHFLSLVDQSSEEPIAERSRIENLLDPFGPLDCTVLVENQFGGPARFIGLKIDLLIKCLSEKV